MTGLWLPPGARPFDDDIERVIAESDDPVEARRLAEELRDLGVTFSTKEGFGATVAAAEDPGHILLPREWMRMPLKDGRKVVCARVDDEALQRSLMDARLEVEVFAVCDEAPDNPFVQALMPALMMQLPHYKTFTPLEWPGCPAPFDWKLACAQGFAIAVAHPDPMETRHLYVASPPMSATPPGMLIETAPRKVGRNDRCPCGSGIKFKRCCGA